MGSKICTLTPPEPHIFLCVAMDKQCGKGLRKFSSPLLQNQEHIDMLNWVIGHKKYNLTWQSSAVDSGGIEKEEDKLRASTSVELRNQL